MQAVPVGRFLAFVDDEDFERVSQFSWQAQKRRGREIVYARSSGGILMHRFILGAPVGTKVDHIDLDGLNNTRSNLRVCTNSQNLANRDMPRTNASGYKGVYWNGKRRKWAAQIGYMNTKINLGHYLNPVSAAKAYDAKAAEIFGAFSRLNFPPEGVAQEHPTA